MTSPERTESVTLFRVRRPDGTLIQSKAQQDRGAAVWSAKFEDEALDGVLGGMLFGCVHSAEKAGYTIEPVEYIPASVAKGLVEALNHARSCGDCSEDSWTTCEGGRAALAALAAAEEEGL